MPVHPQAQEVLDLLQQSGVSQLSDLSVEAARDLIVAMSADRPGPDVAEVRELRAAGPGGDIPIRLYRPAGSSAAEQLPVLVYFHGGGWTIGNLDSHDGTCRWLANRAGVAVASVDYRLGPEHIFPAAVDDCWAATQWVAANAAELGLDADRLVVGGDSAGGNLAAVVAPLSRDTGGPTIPASATRRSTRTAAATCCRRPTSSGSTGTTASAARCTPTSGGSRRCSARRWWALRRRS
jgi:acetyl esterase